MKSITFAATIVALASFVAAVPPFDPSGAPNVGNGAGKQFITGQCLSDADCASGCCANPTGICSGPGASTQQGKTGCGFGGGSAAAPALARTLMERQTASLSATPPPSAAPAPPADPAPSADPAPPADPAPSAAPAPPGSDAPQIDLAARAAATASKGGPPFDPSGVKNVGNGKGTQFIGGQCLSTADCASGCCAGPSGICSGVGAQTQAGKTGCGFNAKRFVSVRSSLEDLD